MHRIGRTGRAGASGEAVSLVCVDENGFVRDIERLIKREIPKEIVPGFAPPAHERPEPIVLGRMVIGEGAGRGGMRHHANGRAPGGGSGGRGGSGGPVHRNGGHANHGGGSAHRQENGARPPSAGQAAHGTARPAARDAHGQPPRPQGPRPEGRHEGRPPARLVQPKR